MPGSLLISNVAALSTTSKSSFTKPIPAHVESLNELEKKTYFCLRILNDERSEHDLDEIIELENASSACIVECKRKDGKPLGWRNADESFDETCIRRSFAFTSAPSRPGKPYTGPCMIHCRQLPFSYGKLGGTVWYAALALAQYISLHPSLVEGKSILELGAG